MIQSKKSPDVLVIGAGVFGLWAARHSILAGRNVLVLDKRTFGAGASGGFVGALMPHMPDRWNDKKQLQFEALTSLPDAIAALEADTGMNCGYRRCGRLMPVRSEYSIAEIDARVEGARRHWRGQYAIERLEPPIAGKVPAGWFDETAAPFGVQHDDLSARIDPRAYLAALKAFAIAHGEVREGADVARIETGKAVLADGSVVAAGEIVVAAGWEAYDLLQPFMGNMARQKGGPIGRGVKGQAVMVEYAHEDDLPIVSADGCYVVPQTGNRVAIGATARDDWETPDSFDPDDMDFYENALELVPALRDAPIIERWANVRPRNMLAGQGTAPFIHKVPGHDWLSARIGGYRIGLGLGHVTPES